MRTDRQTGMQEDMTKLLVPFRHLVNEPEKEEPTNATGTGDNSLPGTTGAISSVGKQTSSWTRAQSTVWAHRNRTFRYIQPKSAQKQDHCAEMGPRFCVPRLLRKPSSKLRRFHLPHPRANKSQLVTSKSVIPMVRTAYAMVPVGRANSRQTSGTLMSNVK